MTLPKDLSPYAIQGLSLRPLAREDVPAMLALQALVLDALPNLRWYVPSDEAEFTQVVSEGDAFGYFENEVLIGFAELSDGVGRGSHSYAAILGRPQAGSFDFHDVMVHPAMRGRGVHTQFLQLFRRMALEAGGSAIYATVDPENQPSWHNFEKAGYALLDTRLAYDGRQRRYYGLTLF